MKSKSSESNLLKGIIAGTVGGLAAALVMNQYQALTAKLGENDQPKKSSNEKPEPATVKAAEMVAEKVFDRELKKSEKEPAGAAMHYLMGGVSGAIYGAAAELTGATTFAAGLPFGSAVWAVADEVVIPALGLSKSPSEYPLSAQAYALSSHWVYGLVTEMVRKAVRKAL
ncbi:MAG: DUF1440 domain-containing protein [Acidobacteriota bacterium]|nr:DUF1440 domain-containing protein [Acidobacteriota bacterium]